MEAGEIFTVIFGLIVFGWMFKAMFPKTYDKANDWAGRLADDEKKDGSQDSGVPKR